jgi:hypothetical protein
MLYGARPADAVLSTRKHNDLLVFEQQAREPMPALRIPATFSPSGYCISPAQMSMLTEYAALISVPIFVISGASLCSCACRVLVLNT